MRYNYALGTLEFTNNGGADWFVVNDGLSPGVLGPATSTDHAIARFNGTSGNSVQDSGVIINDSNDVSGIADLAVTGTTTLDTALSGVVKATAGVISAGDIDLSTEAGTSVLPIANGGTNSSTAL